MEGYDEPNAEEIAEKAKGLSEKEVEQVRSHENRKTLVENPAKRLRRRNKDDAGAPRG